MNPLRRPLIAGNWKMHLSLAESVSLAKAVRDGAAGASSEIVLCAPYTALSVLSETLRGSSLGLSAQDVFWELSGAYTGEISPAQLLDAGCSWVVIGHSERRRLFGDSDEAVAKKLKSALKAGLKPILCVGETLSEREAQETFRVLERQLTSALKDYAPADLASVVVAYEPVWAIGTGKTATPSQAQEAHLFLRKLAARLYGEGFSAGLRILYGGSVKAENVDALMAQPDLDGALVGGESLKPVSFLRIVHFKPTVAA